MRDILQELKSKIIIPCEICDGKGFLPVDDGQVTRCECMRVYRYIKELLISKIPHDYWGLQLEKLNIDNIFKHVTRKYIDKLEIATERGLGLMFFGPNGVGKTSLMCEVGKSAITKHISTRYLTLTNYIHLIQRGEVDEAYKLINAKLLLIDEVDKKYIKKGSNFVEKTVDEFFRNTLNEGKTIILSTNWDEVQLKEVLGESTYSLLSRRCEFIKIKGDDFSKELQSDFWNRLEPIDYFCDAIKIMADRFENYE